MEIDHNYRFNKFAPADIFRASIPQSSLQWHPLSRVLKGIDFKFGRLLFRDLFLSGQCLQLLLLDFIRIDNGIEELGGYVLSQDRDVGHHTVAANRAGKDVRGKEADLLDESVDLFISGIAVHRHPLHFLSPTYQYSEPRGFDQLAEFADLWRPKLCNCETRARKMLRRALGGMIVKTGHEFLIVEHVLHHFGVFASNRAVDDWGANSFLHLPSGSHPQGAVYDGKGGLVPLDVGHRRAHEVLKLKRVADMQSRTGASDLDGRDIDADALVCSL